MSARPPLADGVWIFRFKCGCVYGAMTHRNGWGEFRAGVEFFETAAKADKAHQEGDRWELVSDKDYRGNSKLAPMGCQCGGAR